MDVRLYLERKMYWCEENAQDQRRLDKIENAAWWAGRAASYQELLAAVRSGVVTPDGIEPLVMPVAAPEAAE